MPTLRPCHESLGNTSEHWPGVALQELNRGATHVLFRDAESSLHVLDTTSKGAQMLAPHVTYCQWMPGCPSTVVAQTAAGVVMVWYDVQAPADVQELQVEGEVQHLAFAQVPASMQLPGQVSPSWQANARV